VSREALERINRTIVACNLCPRLVLWRQEAAHDPPARFRGQSYWAKPLPGFGDADARILVVGLAPAAHGGNRTGRMFTGDRSGDFLFGVLHDLGLANQGTSTHVGDGLRLADVYVGAVNRCAPPANRPTPTERDSCLPYLAAEIRALERLRVVVCLGSYAWDGALRAVASLGHAPAGRGPKPRFAHGAEVQVGPYTLLGSFHPSQQNTFTGRLTVAMLAAVFERARHGAASLHSA
jgi:uracil-DNA glycosylase family 4